MSTAALLHWGKKWYFGLFSVAALDYHLTHNYTTVLLGKKKTGVHSTHLGAVIGSHLHNQIEVEEMPQSLKNFPEHIRCELIENSTFAFYLSHQLAFHHWPVIK